MLWFDYLITKVQDQCLRYIAFVFIQKTRREYGSRLNSSNVCQLDGASSEKMIRFKESCSRRSFNLHGFSGRGWISVEDRRKEERKRENEREMREKRSETKRAERWNEGWRGGFGVGILGSRHSAASERVRREPEVYFREPHRFRKLYSLYEPERLTANPSLVWLAALSACTNWDLCGDLSSSLFLS